MEIKDNIFTGDEASDKIITGITKTVDVIRHNYGASGSNTILEEQVYPFFRVTNDAKTSIDRIKLADTVEQIGANIIKEAGNKQDALSGDGRKTTMLLTEAIFKEAKKVEGTPMSKKRALDACLPLILKSIDDQTKQITIDDIEAVATVSSERPETGKIIGEIYKTLGKDCYIELNYEDVPEDTYTITEGVKLRGAKLFSAYSVTSPMGSQPVKAEWENPLILISKDKITDAEQIEGIFKEMIKSGKRELVIYCEDIEMPAYTRLAKTHTRETQPIKTLIIKSPTLWKPWLYEDFSAMTGATIVDSKEGKTFKDIKLEDLGTCDKIVSTYNVYDGTGETKVIGIKDISEHIKILEEAAKNDDQMNLRVSWLKTKVAILNMGSHSDTELAYKSKKALDAIASARLALDGGVVLGGGSCLAWIEIDNEILGEALKAPVRQIQENSGKPIIFKELEDQKIYDAALIVKNAITNAISIAGTALTSRSVVTLPDIKQQQIPR